MMTDGRRFLRQTTGTMGLALASSDVLMRVNAAVLRLGAAAPEQVAGDEAFWTTVREAFEVAPEYTNLVSVMRGNSTKANRNPPSLIARIRRTRLDC